MTDIAVGSLVKHVSLGIGKVVAVETTAVHVFFPESEKRYAAKLRWPAASVLLTKDGIEPAAWLQGLTSFALDAVRGRYALAANFISHDEAIAQFLESCPQAFADPARVEGGGGKRERSSLWRAANAEWIRALGGGEGERLLADGELRELVRRALRVGAHVTGIRGMVEQEALEEALEPGDLVAGFFEALFGLLSAPAPARARTEKLFAASEALGVGPEFAWPMATVFPFVAEPARQVILLPKVAGGAATRLGCDLRLKPSPTWAAYAALRDLATQLLAKLQPSGARDFIDVESFLHATTVKRPPPAAARAKPGPRPVPSTAARARREGATVAAPRKKR